ncbi:hypothetical protein LFL96_06475 [Paraburkholderia sp. D15]|uniref:hypothetical protein n=1 Tax=Paraburkholderia sp. D15 TaxID=2880218 RepID=UPI002479F74D|nr:hypothetical protein [Paraburkholderia sp. D15]WGS51144.1 hypothetical protein LFL96_06475 [Paraburkholderia sp. D15]
MTEHEIYERPVFDHESGNPAERISLEKLGLSLEFMRPGAYKEQYGSTREDGEMIFSSIFIYAVPEDGFDAYSGEVFPELSISVTQQEAVKQFGPAARVRDEGDRFGRPNNIELTWNDVNGFSIFIRFLKNPPAVRHMVISPAEI